MSQVPPLVHIEQPAVVVSRPCMRSGFRLLATIHVVIVSATVVAWYINDGQYSICGHAFTVQEYTTVSAERGELGILLGSFTDLVPSIVRVQVDDWPINTSMEDRIAGLRQEFPINSTLFVCVTCDDDSGKLHRRMPWEPAYGAFQQECFTLAGLLLLDLIVVVQYCRARESQR